MHDESDEMRRIEVVVIAVVVVVVVVCPPAWLWLERRELYLLFTSQRYFCACQAVFPCVDNAGYSVQKWFRASAGGMDGVGGV